MKKIYTYIINLKERSDRLEHILNEFKSKDEFEIEVIDAVKHQIGAIGLWNSIIKVVEAAKSKDLPFVLFCEDDHIFTEHYSIDNLFSNITMASQLRADMLLGGIAGSGTVLPIQKNLFWIDWFWCTQFTIIFEKFYKKVLDAKFQESDVADEFLSKLTTEKLVIYPFISEQKDFFYSDVTDSNNGTHLITTLFKKSCFKFERIDIINSYYNSLR